MLMTDTARATLRETAQRARRRTMHASLITTLIVGFAAYFAAGDIAAQGVVLGGFAGAMGFWTMSKRLEQIALVRPDRLAVAATVWTMYRILIYSVFLVIAYRLDRENMYGLLGAIAGLFSTRLAITLIGVRQAKAAQANSGAGSS